MSPSIRRPATTPIATAAPVPIPPRLGALFTVSGALGLDLLAGKLGEDGTNPGGGGEMCNSGGVPGKVDGGDAGSGSDEGGGGLLGGEGEL